MFGTFVQFIVVLADGSFLSRVGGDDFNAAGIGGVMYVAFFMLGVGFASGAQILIARREGEGRYREVGSLFNHTLVGLLLMGVTLFVAFFFLGPVILGKTLKSEAIFVALDEFLHYRSWGFIVSFINLALVAFYVGVARTNILIWTTLITAGVNIVLDYALIFGNWGFPQMGVGGAALASLLSEITALVFAIIYTIFNPTIKKYCLLKFRRLYKNVIRRLFRISWPLMIQQFLSLAAWFIFFNLIEQLGSQELEASNVVRHLYFLAMVPIMGFSSVTKTFVSNLIAQKKLDEVVPAIKKIVTLSAAFTSFIVLMLLLFPHFFIGVINEDPNVVEMSISILHVVAVSLVLFSISTVLFNMISGSGDTRSALLIEFSIIVVYLFAASYVAVVRQADIQVVWYCEYIYFGLLGLVSFVYLKKGKWKTIQV